MARSRYVSSHCTKTCVCVCDVASLHFQYNIQRIIMLNIITSTSRRRMYTQFLRTLTRPGCDLVGNSVANEERVTIDSSIYT